MASYKLLIKPSAAKEIELAPKKDRLRIIKRIQDLSSDPRPPGCEKLSGHDDKYRVRQGTYRIVYSVSDAGLVICVVKVGHRKEVYR
ncbi:type II toxin-antitoxin system RelE family toxin [Candidatus Deferrimicrobium sp.]|uniref:type II toxin-antitoxin system RelE family toxin n=1 Tax=Candidatus Deferrimicrobium sp. TaxID=3060586 RepID=UPI003C4F9817